MGHTSKSCSKKANKESDIGKSHKAKIILLNKRDNNREHNNPEDKKNKRQKLK